MMMDSAARLPGTEQHQRMLKAIVEHYQNDERILAIIVFGSLGRGNWDRFSDLDLDFITKDGENVTVQEEIEGLSKHFADIDEYPVILIPHGEEEADIVFESLLELSMRFHPLATTNPSILDSMRLLAGELDSETIQRAGLANQKENVACSRLLDQCVRYAIDADTRLQRGEVWSTVEILHRMRSLVMALYSQTHDGKRAYQSFEQGAGEDWQKTLGATLPSYSLESLQSSLIQLLEILQSGLEDLTEGQVQLSQVHRKILNNIRARQFQ